MAQDKNMILEALEAAKSAFLADVEQPTKFDREFKYSGGYTDTVYHLDGAKVGGALEKVREAIRFF